MATLPTADSVSQEACEAASMLRVTTSNVWSS